MSTPATSPAVAELLERWRRLTEPETLPAEAWS